MISKEKQILFENFNRRSVKRNNTKNIMDKMFQGKMRQLRKNRQEEYLNKVEEWKKKPSFDISKMNQNVSPTSKSPSRSFISLQEQRDRDFWNELDEIQEWLDN